jgi:hypothetical protein
VCLSQLAKKGSFFHDLKEFGRLNYANAFRRWVEWEQKARAALSRPGVRATQVRYEELVAAPERELARLAEFLGVAFEPGMLDYAQAAHDFPGWEAGSTDVAERRAISAGSVGAWRRTRMTPEMRYVLAKYENFLVGIGYPPSDSTARLSDRAAAAAFSLFCAPALRALEALRGRLRVRRALNPRAPDRRVAGP